MTDQFHHTPVGVIIKLEDGRQSLSRRYFDKMAFHARKPVIDIKQHPCRIAGSDSAQCLSNTRRRSERMV